MHGFFGCMCDSPEHNHGVLKWLVGWERVVVISETCSNFCMYGIPPNYFVFSLNMCHWFLLFPVCRLPCPMHRLQ